MATIGPKLDLSGDRPQPKSQKVRPVETLSVLRTLLRSEEFRSGLQATAIFFAVWFGYLEVSNILAPSPNAPPIGVRSVPAILFAIAGGAILIVTVLATANASLIRRVAITAGVAVMVVAAQSAIDLFNQWLMGQILNAGDAPWAMPSAKRFWWGISMYSWIYALDLSLIINANLKNSVARQRHELAEARTAAAQAQLAMLRYQINPHFLFNTLNAISSLVVNTRPKEADEMLARLCSFLRASLASEPNDYVRLDAELDVIQEYLDIERVRFGERLAVEFACEAEVSDALIPGFLLQPLVENAIKYAVSPARRPVTIRIDARLDGDDLLVMVADDGDGIKDATRGGTGVGLRNVRDRLTALYGSQGVLEAVPLEQGFLAIVRLPARKTADAREDAR